MFQNKRISKYVRPFLEKNLFCFKKKVYDLDHVVKEVTVVNGTIPNAEPKSDDKKPTETLDRFQSHSNGYINNSYIPTTDDKLEKMQEPPTADPEDAGDTPFHGHIPSKYILQNFQILHLSDLISFKSQLSPLTSLKTRLMSLCLYGAYPPTPVKLW